MEAIRVLIVDNDSSSRGRLKALLREHEYAVVVGECSHASACLSAISREQPDLVFLELQLPGTDRIDILGELLRIGPPAIIFVTAEDRHAMRAFEFHAVDYLLKPYSSERFRLALARARSQILHDRLDELSARLVDLLGNLQMYQVPIEKKAVPRISPYLERIAVPVRGSVKVIKVREIDYIVATGMYAELHVNGKTHLLRETLTSLEDRLDPTTFIRIHRSTIVNVECVSELKATDHGDYIVILTSGARLKLARSRRNKLDMLLGG